MSTSLPSLRSFSRSCSASLIAAEEYAPASPRSLVTTRIAARLLCSGSVVSGWSTLEYVATAETARVSSRAYGAADWARCWALMMREAAMSSMARVIFFVDSTERIRARYSRSESATSAPLLLDDLLLLDLVVRQRLLLL